MKRKILMIVGRDDWMKTEYMSRALLDRMDRLGMETVWEDPAGKWIYACRRLAKKAGVRSERFGRFPLRIIQGLYGLTHWVI